MGPFLLSPFIRHTDPVAKWCTVTVTDGEGKRYSLDIQADSSFDAAHLLLNARQSEPGLRLPDTNYGDAVRSRYRRKRSSCPGTPIERMDREETARIRRPAGLPFQSTSDDRLLISCQVVAAVRRLPEGGLPRRFGGAPAFASQDGGLPRRLPLPAASRSRLKIASPSCSCSRRSSSRILLTSISDRVLDARCRFTSTEESPANRHTIVMSTDQT